ncbi:hypothetical protein [Sphingomonas alpina]|uniref:M28 family peptidase n=1 Tax=Sphingomonas alpina TaxID=653931 RepID=A0A7H0LP11_9SPHN|nr:hypothetical protein [Sphingomonas alpina]QNQ11414.1 hypothetical protein H3Z74_09885 [Sphingomonas alpina]
MAAPTRRDVLTASGATLVAAPAAALADPAVTDRLSADLDRYIGFGNKASGGAGDTACGEWLQAELAAAGFRVERQTFTVPWFEARHASLTMGRDSAPLIPQAIVVPTGAGGVSGPLVRIDPGAGASGPLRGAVALLDLPFQRWSSAVAKPIREPVTAAFAAGVAGVVIVTNGPTGEALALNATGTAPMFPGPVGVIAPKQARPFLADAIAGRRATLRIDGEGGARAAFNLIGRIDRGAEDWIVVSTPRSGWFDCAGERGPGIAVWLALARWAGRELKSHNLAFLCNSGHEYENLGSEHALRAAAPPPGRTTFWLHLGANVASRDWHELGAGMLMPLPSADPQRFLVTSPALVDVARRAFAGQSGLEMAYPSGQGSAGELTNILAAGYAGVAGIFGAHRFHHAATDDARCVSTVHAAQVFDSCRVMISGISAL